MECNSFICVNHGWHTFFDIDKQWEIRVTYDLWLITCSLIESFEHHVTDRSGLQSLHGDLNFVFVCLISEGGGEVSKSLSLLPKFIEFTIHNSHNTLSN